MNDLGLVNDRASHVDLDALREELLAMLESKSPEAPGSSNAAESEQGDFEPVVAQHTTDASGPARTPARHVEGDPCPHCGSTTPWKSASWCPDCGYYPAIGRVGEIPDSTDAEEFGDIALGDLFPGWLRASLGGMVAIVALTFAFEHYSGGRLGYLSLGSLVLLSLGGILAFTAHVGAFFAGLRTSSDVTVVKFLCFPLDVWKPVFKRLPENSGLIARMAWGVTMCISALSILGPIKLDEIKKDILSRQKPKQSVVGTMVSTMAKATGQPTPATASGDFEESLEGFAGKALGQSGLDGDLAGQLESGVTGDLTGDLSGGLHDGLVDPPALAALDAEGELIPPNAQAAAQEVSRCLVFGYLTNAEGEIRSVLLSTDGTQSRPRFIATLPVSLLTATDREVLVAALPQLRVERPLTWSPYGGQWVEPSITLAVWSDGVMYNQFQNPTARVIERSRLSQQASRTGPGITPEVRFPVP